uniref:Phenylacetate-coenzyme A ligase n=1 Tax=Serratia marcescens TaxID=615 RepID=A0A1C3HA32_SERMA|nr:Phenylacetate-coenzyme A ligase [Serratia marcescens]
MEERTLADGTLVLPVAHDLLATPARMIKQALDEIAAYDPEILVVDPTHLAFLTREAAKLGRTIVTTNKLHIVCGYTHLTQVARRQIRHFFGDGTPIGNMLGMSELGYLGFECHHGCLHINNQDFFLEFLSGELESALDEVGELVISTIDDSLLPRIRYATGDLYRLSSEPCTCGRHFAGSQHRRARHHNVIGKNGAIVTPAEVDLAVTDCPRIDLYKLEQDELGNLRFRYILNQHHRSELFALQQRISALCQNPRHHFRAVDYIRLRTQRKIPILHFQI